MLSDLLVTVLLAGAGVASLAASRRPETTVVGISIEYRGLRTLTGVLVGIATLVNSVLWLSLDESASHAARFAVDVVPPSPR